MIEKSRFEEKILANLPPAGTQGASRVYAEVTSRYILQDPFDPTIPTATVADMRSQYPITNKMAVYVFISDAVKRDFTVTENHIKTYCPDYTFDELQADHTMTEYVGTDLIPPLFKLSLEYSLTENGMSCTLPANGITFDETVYQLDEVQVLPYMGAGSSEFTGYTFIPDGSGAITRFEDFKGKSINAAGKMYGSDYAYHMVTGSTAETMRLPVYGIVENAVTNKLVTETVENEVTDPETGEVTIEQREIMRSVPVTRSKGFLAIIEEGDALMTLMSTSGSTTHKYYNILTSFNPRPYDEYNLSGAISVGSTSSSIRVTSSRKYVGNLTMRFVMLTDKTIAAENNITNSYEPSWVGMATAYRDYLEQKGVLTPLENTSDQIPLYIETLGADYFTEQILSIPVEVMKPFATFDDVISMYDDLSAAGINNVDFRLNGYANGGMFSTAASRVKWVKEVGGEEGYKKLNNYAAEKDFGVYPDFDISYVQTVASFDGFEPKRDAIKTIDDRYTSKIIYSSAAQYYNMWGYCISPSVFLDFYEGIAKTFLKYNPTGISFATIGTDLNSDFNTDRPYNREDSKVLVQGLLERAKADIGSIMLDGGNAYTLGYADHLLNVSLDSSRYILTSEAVPFMGMVLHGSVNFAGSPINYSGDTDYEILKAIENGASIYFILAKQNIEYLKKYTTTAKYFSVRYDIWFDELVELYGKLNEAVSDLQDKKLINHEFLAGYRVPDDDELIGDALAAERKLDEDELAKQKQNRAAKLQKLRELYVAGSIPAGLTEIPLEYLEIIEEPTDTDSELAAEKAEEIDPKYSVQEGSIVKVTYEGGVSFILNYNNFAIDVTDGENTHRIDAYGYVRTERGAQQ
jgi:hypothetical protein